MDLIFKFIYYKVSLHWTSVYGKSKNKDSYRGKLHINIKLSSKDLNPLLSSYCVILSQYFCHQKVDPTPYLEACKLDCCGGGDAVTCGCKSFEAYARACMDASPTLRDLSWRSDQICRKLTMLEILVSSRSNSSWC